MTAQALAGSLAPESKLKVALRAIVSSPAGMPKVLPALRRFLMRDGSRSAAEQCEINSLDDYEEKYRALAAMLGRPGKFAPQAEVAALAKLMEQHRAVIASLSGSDCFFLTAVASIIAPRRVVEIGTLSGFSAGVIASAIRRERDDAAGVVDTIDLRTHCHNDPERPVGYAIREIFPEHADAIRIHAPHDSRHVAQLAPARDLELAFVDASHRHPNPLLDVLRLAAHMQPGAWILLHDIRLGSTGAEPSASAPWGAEWLFDAWPLRKISGGNIGAVQLPDERSALAPFALEMMRLPTELNARNAADAATGVYAALRKLA